MPATAYSAIASVLPAPREVVTITSLPHRSPMQQVAGAGRPLMKPFQPRRPGAQIEREWPAAKDDFGFGEQAVAFLAGARAVAPGAR